MKSHYPILVIFATLSTVFGQSVSAQTASTFTIKAVTANGTDTGTCLANPGNSLGGWTLKTCNKNDPLQQFSFDTTISQTTAAGVKCVAVLNGLTSNIKVNSIVAKSDCNVAGASVKWMLNNKQLVLADTAPATKTKFCLTANSSLGKSLRLGDCSQPATLTNWVVTPIP